MSGSKHTPGPWQGVEARGAKGVRRICYVNPVGTTDGGVAFVYDKEDPAVAEANARLIIAAPEMLAFIEEVKEEYDKYLDDDSEVYPYGLLDVISRRIDGLLNKAKGTEPCPGP